MGSKALSFSSYYRTKAFWNSETFRHPHQVKYQVYSKIGDEFKKRNESVNEVIAYLEDIYISGIKQFVSFNDHIPLFEKELKLLKTSKEEAIRLLFSENGFLTYRIIQIEKEYKICNLGTQCFNTICESNKEEYVWNLFLSKVYKRKYAAIAWILDWLHCSREYIDPAYQFDPELSAFAEHLSKDIANAMNEIIEQRNDTTE